MNPGSKYFSPVPAAPVDWQVRRGVLLGLACPLPSGRGSALYKENKEWKSQGSQRAPWESLAEVTSGVGVSQPRAKLDCQLDRERPP